MGVAPATLRTWDRRYGVGPTEHRPGAHRRYTACDLARLEHMRRLVIAGITPAEAARAARALDVSADDVAPVTALPAVAAPPAVDASETGRAGGGRVVPLPGGAPLVRGLARAAQSLDVATCGALIADSLARRGAVWTWESLLVPVLHGIGQRWSDTGNGVDVEHALSGVIQDCLSAHIRTAPPALNNRAALLACAPDELHSLPLWALAAALAERRVATRILGASLPASALSSAVQRLGPAVVFVWAQIPGIGDPGQLAALPPLRPAATVLIGGPGWAGSGTPEGVVRVADLPDAVARITHAVGG